MNLSRVRQILKEEARKILKEAVQITTAKAAVDAINQGTIGMGRNAATDLLSIYSRINMLIRMAQTSAIGRIGGMETRFPIALAKIDGFLVNIVNALQPTNDFMNAANTANAAQTNSPENEDLMVFASLVTGQEYSQVQQAMDAIGLNETAWAGGRLNEIRAKLKGLSKNISEMLNYSNQGEVIKNIVQKPVANPMPVPTVDQNPVPQPVADTTQNFSPQGKDYTIKAGESISKIAQTYYGIAPSQAAMPVYQQLAKMIQQGTSQQAPTGDPNKIYPGQVIKLPPTLSVGGKQYTYKI